MGILAKIKEFFDAAVHVFNAFFKSVFTTGLKKFIGMYVEDAILAAGDVEKLGLGSAKEKQDKWLEIFKARSKSNPQEFGDWGVNLLRELAVAKFRVTF
jgi:hypothetical protein